MLPLQYAIYKGTGGKHGAIQFSPQSPHFYSGKGKDQQKDFTGSKALGENGRRKEGWKIREGAVFVNITSTKDKNVYDWDNQVVMALSVHDLGEILYFLTTGKNSRGDDTLSLMHDPGAKTEREGLVKKSLQFYSPNGTAAGVIVTARQQSGGEEKKHSVPVSGPEVVILRSLFQGAISRALNW